MQTVRTGGRTYHNARWITSPTPHTPVCPKNNNGGGRQPHPTTGRSCMSSSRECKGLDRLPYPERRLWFSEPVAPKTDS